MKETEHTTACIRMLHTGTRVLENSPTPQVMVEKKFIWIWTETLGFRNALVVVRGLNISISTLIFGIPKSAIVFKSKSHNSIKAFWELTPNHDEIMNVSLQIRWGNLRFIVGWDKSVRSCYPLKHLGAELHRAPCSRCSDKAFRLN